VRGILESMAGELVALMKKYVSMIIDRHTNEKGITEIDLPIKFELEIFFGEVINLVNEIRKATREGILFALGVLDEDQERQKYIT